MTTSAANRRSKVARGPDILAHLPLDRRARVPLHQQIYDGLRRAILNGSLRPGQRIPSSRALAAELHVSRLPVLMTYDQLLHEGYLDGRVGSGTFVRASLPDDLLRALPVARRTPSETPRPRDEGGRRPFRASVPALDQFPHALWARVVARHAQVLIVSGSQSALRLCASVLLARGDHVAVEEPGYPGARSALSATGAELAPVVVDADGMDVAALMALGSRVRAAYVTPSHQYPLGVSMTATRRLALLDWADRHGAWIIEDDYDSEYRYVSRPLGALQGMDGHGRVVYVGTFSKALFPALRVGYLVVPPQLWNDFMDAREAFDVFPSTLYQLALEVFLREGHFARHLRRMRPLYAARRAALLAGLERHCRGLLTVHNSDAGLHMATLLRAGLDDVTVVRRMTERGLTATALSTCYTGSRRRSGLLLGFGGWDARRIGDATGALGRIVRDLS